MAAVDKKVVEDRLTCRESVITGHTGVLRVAARFNAFVAALAGGAAASGGGTDASATHDALVKELMLMRLEVGGCELAGVGTDWCWMWTSFHANPPTIIESYNCDARDHPTRLTPPDTHLRCRTHITHIARTAGQGPRGV